MDWLDVVVLMGGQELTTVDDPLAGHCPTCGCQTRRTPSGALRLCLPCTEDEVGETAHDLSRRIGRKMTAKAYWALPLDSDGQLILPSLTNRQWRQITG